MNNPLSPITANNNITLTDTFCSNDIIKLYKDQLDIDVSASFSGIQSVFLYQCNQTGYRFYYPEGLNGDGHFYARLQQQMNDAYYLGWKFENQLALNIIKMGDKVLDIGCGNGNFLEKVKEKAKEVTGLELNDEAVKICKQKGLQVVNEVISEHAVNKTDHYDVVCIFQVLEHIYDVRSFLADSLKVLKKGGKLIIGVPNSEPYFQGYDKYSTLNLPPHHMGLWNKRIFENLEQLFNLKMKQAVYDVKGRTLAYAYLKAKYLANIKSLPGSHTFSEKIKMILWGSVTVPMAILKKITSGINGSHLAVVFEKQ